jgi:serine/threonine-protein kinase
LPDVSEATDLVGTPAYMAPEMLMGNGTLLSARTDVYLLGAILYEIFTGVPPHDGPTLNAMITRVLLSNPTYDASFPAEAQAICARAMSREPSDRYPTAEALRLDIEAYLRHRGSRRIASEAKQSLARLVHAIENEPRGEERALAVFNLLGECRFGYRSALSAWPENERARQGLDRALLAVAEYELAEGDPNAAVTLLREVSAPPPEVSARVEAAVAERAAEEERLRKLEADADPTVGGRTRSFISGLLGVFWVGLPLFGWCLQLRGKTALTHTVTVGLSSTFFAVSLALVVWARETMQKTQYNRRVALTLTLYLGAQAVLAAGAWAAGVTPELAVAVMMFSWAITEAMLAVWVHPWFGVPAAVALVSFVVTAWWPMAALPLVSLDSLVLTLVGVFAWVPRQDIARIQEQRRALRRRARAWLASTGGEAQGE